MLVQSASPHHAVGCKVVPGLGVDIKCFYASLANIPVALLAAFGSPSRCQLSIKNDFWDAAILHAVDLPQPTQPALSEQGEHAWNVGSGQDLGVGHSVLPGYAKDTADAYPNHRSSNGVPSTAHVVLLLASRGPCPVAVRSTCFSIYSAKRDWLK